MLIRKHIKDILLAAIDKAEQWGKCKYTDNGKPCCVAGQACALVGISIEHMENWEGTHFRAVANPSNCVDGLFMDKLVNEAFTKDEQDMLYSLQRLWDNTAATLDELSAKAEMRYRVLNTPTAE